MPATDPTTAGESVPLPRLSSQIRDAFPSPAFTFRACLIGIFLGTLCSASNLFFALQTGIAPGTALPVSLLGFVLLKLCRPVSTPSISASENVLVQTVAGSMSFMPITASFSAVVPALEYVITREENGPLSLSWQKLFVWAFTGALIGTVLVLSCYEYFIFRWDLPFPTASATAFLIKSLNSESQLLHHDYTLNEDDSPAVNEQSSLLRQPRENGISAMPQDYRKLSNTLSTVTCISGIYTLITYFVPILNDLPVFGNTAAEQWMWTFNLSPGYIGQGIITGPINTLHMLSGAIVGWAMLSPLAKLNGWAPGQVEDRNNGSSGWIIWPSLAALLADSMVGLIWFVYSKSVKTSPQLQKQQPTSPVAPLNPTRESIPQLLSEHMEDNGSDISSREDRSRSTARPSSHSTSNTNSRFIPKPSSSFSFATFLFAYLMCISTVWMSFGPYLLPWETTIAVALSIPLSIVGIQALGATDFIPASAIGRLVQCVFAVLISKSNPNAIIINLVAGAITEACMCVAADAAGHLKVAYDVGAPGLDQLYGEIIGAAFGAFVCSCFYKVYTSVYPIPGRILKVPSAYVWVSAARLLTGQPLPPQAGNFTLAFGFIFSSISLLKATRNHKRWYQLLPNGTAFAIGMFVSPAFTLPRAVGGLISWWWIRRQPDDTLLLVLASGMVLGEGVCQLLNLVLGAMRVPRLM